MKLKASEKFRSFFVDYCLKYLIENDFEFKNLYLWKYKTKP